MGWPQVILIIVGAMFSPSVVNNWLKTFGVTLNQSDVEQGVAPVAVAQPAQPVPPATPGAVQEKGASPTFAQTANDAVKNPTSLLFLGVGALGVALLASQVRAGFHEASETTKDLYKEGTRVSHSASGADGGPKNYSRRAKG
ncbi:hypothetical protein GO986_21860 [Deinococcus sp. HMF7620]|uniref:Uncharacterized protein n=1 Tax=Deinococcus arboris TaxID=2682977 RepID=A0A7C9M9H5_9DEIO|nr:hypothetical protein [Deinococcus arboris]MVN89385.1 hypothetical protein [Deinococcus arboris]